MRKIIAFLLAFSLLLGGCAAQPSKKDIGTLTVHYISVEHADCILLVAGDTTVLIDGGNTGTSRDVVNYLQHYGVEELDLMVNTHPHGDHLGGLPAVLAKIPVETVWSSTDTYDSYLFADFMELVDRQDADFLIPAPGTVFQQDALSIQVLGPIGENYTDLNDTSLVLMVRFGDRKFLFTGDMEAFAEYQLVNADVNLKADVLKVGHHGSYSSTSQAFLDEVDPDYAVISCGYGNEYGHPHDGPMNRLENAEVTLFRTDLMGNVVIMTDGEELTFFLETQGVDAYAPAA